MADKKQLAQLIKSYVEQDSAPEARQSIVKELIETTARAPGAALVLDLITDRVKSTPPSSQLHLIHLLEQLVTTESLEGSVEAANARVQYVTSGAWMDRFVTVTKKEIQVPENRSAVEAWIRKFYSHYGNLHAVQRAVERLHLQDVGLTCDSSQRSGTSQADAGSTFLPPAIDTISTHSEEFHPILTPSPSFIASGRGHVQRSNTENEAPHDTPRLSKPSKSSPRLTSFRNLYEKIKSSQVSSSPATSEPSSPSAGAGPSDTMGLFPSSVARSIVEELQADVSNVTMGLQRPSLMRPDVVADIRRNQKHLDELLENGNLTKSVRQQLLQLQKDVQEALSLHDAIHGKEKSQNATPSSAHEEIPDSVLQDLQEEKERLELKLQTLRSRNAQFQTDINERLRSLDRCLDAGVGVPEMQNASTIATTTTTTTNHRSQQDALVRAMVRTSQHCTTVQQLVGQLRQLGQSTKQLVTDCGGIQEVCRSFPDCLHNDRNVTLAETRRMQETYMEEMALRKHYYNMIQELKGNIRVYCRVRPMSEKEKAAHASVVHFPRPDELVLQENEARNRTFEFDAVFDPETPQVKVFEDTEPLIDSVVDGYNVCIFAYGQTGSGKTYTMSGPNEDHGINRRALARLFEIIEERNHTDTFTVHVSALEIYNEEIRDLQRKRSENAGLSFDIKTGGETGHYVTNLTSTPVTSLSEVESVIHRASSNRSEGRTNMNLHSSRSHMILYVVVRSVNKETGFKTYGKLSLVDLAGSERLDKSGAVGEAKTEATFINKSLTALGMVMSSLSASAQHVPYRNSKLTFLLQDSMTGQAKVLMFVCVSGCSYNISESMSSLQFASRVRGINLGKAQRNVS